MTCIKSSHLKDRVSVRVANRGEIFLSEHLGQGISPSGLFLYQDLPPDRTPCTRHIYRQAGLCQRYDTPVAVFSTCSSLSVTEFFMYK